MRISRADKLLKFIPKNYIGRNLESVLSSELYKEEITVLYGARQVGKSSLVNKCIYDLLLKEDRDIFYYNLDYPTGDFENPDYFINNILSQHNNRDKQAIIFIDEAQRLDNIGVFIKYIYDGKYPFKFVLTGSASLDIKQKIKEPLTGRKREFHLGPLQIDEILKAIHNVDIRNVVGNFKLLQDTLEDYLLYGGYPGVVALVNKEAKKEKIEEIAKAYIYKDMADLFELRNEKNLKMVISFLADNIGNLLSIDSISRLSGISQYEISKIIEALEKTFVISLVKPFYKDKTKELTHNSKIYFYDNGLRNALLNKLDLDILVGDKGQLFENTVFAILSSLFSSEYVKYWRTINKTEVDFVVDKFISKLLVLESKYSWQGDKKARNVEGFVKKYSDLIQKSLVVSKENYFELWKLM
jgi:hypothetical protein